MSDRELLCECGHLHVNPDGSGSCSVFLCPCTVFRAPTVGDRRDRRYREGFDDGLRWVLERFNLDTEDVDALNEALERGPWQ